MGRNDRLSGASRAPGALLGGVEAGGTKLICVIGRGPDAIDATTRIEVTDPATTLGAAIAFFRDEAAAGRAVDALGIASFGPLDLRRDSAGFGRITTTPKPGWSGTPMVRPFAEALGVPVGFDTDVNAAALAEGRWGAAQGLRTFIYLTVGTGIGGGAIAEGTVLHGLSHPEMGHVVVPRRAGDAFAGSCPFHGDCLEGMASGPALAARFGRRAETLGPDERKEAVAIAAHYLAAGIATLAYVLAPERIVVGGGVAALQGLIEAVNAALPARFAGYLPGGAAAGPGYVVPAALGGMAGPAGALLLAEGALAD